MTYRRSFVRFRVTRKAKEGERCASCGKVLKGEVAMLHFDERDGTWHQDNVFLLWSKGWRPFNKQCARLKLKQRSARILDRAHAIAMRSKAGQVT